MVLRKRMRKRATAAASLDGKAAVVALFYRFKRRPRYIRLEGDEGQRYYVTLAPAACSCPDYLYRRLGRGLGDPCKHLRAVVALYVDKGVTG